MDGAGAYAMIPAADCALVRAVRSRPLIGLGTVTDVTGSRGKLYKSALRHSQGADSSLK